MANNNFDSCLSVTLYFEGGYSNNIHDPGGITNLGVTKAAWDAYNGGDASAADMKALTVDDVTPFYKDKYWDVVGGDNLPAGVDLCVFDFGVNAGNGRAVKHLQGVLGVTQDGQFGPASTQALNDYISQNSAEDLINALCDDRMAYYKSLSNYQYFGKGWQKRVEGIRAKAIGMS